MAIDIDKWLAENDAPSQSSAGTAKPSIDIDRWLAENPTPPEPEQQQPQPIVQPKPSVDIDAWLAANPEPAPKPSPALASIDRNFGIKRSPAPPPPPSPAAVQSAPTAPTEARGRGIPSEPRNTDPVAFYTQQRNAAREAVIAAKGTPDEIPARQAYERASLKLDLTRNDIEAQRSVDTAYKTGRQAMSAAKGLTAGLGVTGLIAPAVWTAAEYALQKKMGVADDALPVGGGELATTIAANAFGMITTGMKLGPKASALFAGVKNPMVAAGLGRATIAATREVLNNIPEVGFDKKGLGRAVADTAIAGLSSYASVIPEFKIEPGVGNLIGQVAGDLAVDAVLRSPEWVKAMKDDNFAQWFLTSELPSMAMSLGFALADITPSGRMKLAGQQAAYRQMRSSGKARTLETNVQRYAKEVATEFNEKPEVRDEVLRFARIGTEFAPEAQPTPRADVAPADITQSVLGRQADAGILARAGEIDAEMARRGEVAPLQRPLGVSDTRGMENDAARTMAAGGRTRSGVSGVEGSIAERSNRHSKQVGVLGESYAGQDARGRAAQSGAETTAAEVMGQTYGVKVIVGEHDIGGEYSGNRVIVGSDTTPIRPFAADWTRNDAPDFQASREYPQNQATAAHEIAHALFSRNPQDGQKALDALIQHGVPRDMAFESLVDLGGLYLLEPRAITDAAQLRIIGQWLDQHIRTVQVGKAATISEPQKPAAQPQAPEATRAVDAAQAAIDAVPPKADGSVDMDARQRVLDEWRAANPEAVREVENAQVREDPDASIRRGKELGYDVPAYESLADVPGAGQKLYHGTTRANAESILSAGTFRGFLANRRGAQARTAGEVTIVFDVPEGARRALLDASQKAGTGWAGTTADLLPEGGMRPAGIIETAMQDDSRGLRPSPLTLTPDGRLAGAGQAGQVAEPAARPEAAAPRGPSPYKVGERLSPAAIRKANFKQLKAAAAVNLNADGSTVLSTTPKNIRALRGALLDHRAAYMQAEGKMERAPMSAETRGKLSKAAKMRMANKAEADFLDNFVMREMQEAKTGAPKPVNEAELEDGDLVRVGSEWMRVRKDGMETVLEDGVTLKLDAFESVQAKKVIQPDSPAFDVAKQDFDAQEAGRPAQPTAEQPRPTEGTLLDVAPSRRTPVRGETAVDQRPQEELLKELRQSISAGKAERAQGKLGLDIDAEGRKRNAGGFLQLPGEIGVPQRPNKMRQWFRQHFLPSRGADPALYDRYVTMHGHVAAGNIESKANISRVNSLIDAAAKSSGADKLAVRKMLVEVVNGRLPLNDFLDSAGMQRNAPEAQLLRDMHAEKLSRQQLISAGLRGSQDLKRRIAEFDYYQTRMYERFLMGDNFQPDPEDYRASVGMVADEIASKMGQIERVGQKLAVSKAPFGSGSPTVVADVSRWLVSGDTRILNGLSKSRQDRMRSLRNSYMRYADLVDTVAQGADGGFVLRADATKVSDAAKDAVDYYLSKSDEQIRGESGVINLRHRVLDEVWRKLYGEVTDPAYTAAKTTEVQTKLLAQQSFFRDMYDSGRDKWWWERSAPGRVQLGSAQSNQDRLRYGSMAGKFVTQETADLLIPSPRSNSAARKIADAMFFRPQATMRLLKLYGPKTIVRNYVTAYTGFALGSGDAFLPGFHKHFAGAHKLLMDYKAGKEYAIREIQALAQNNVFRTSASSIVQDIEAGLSVAPTTKAGRALQATGNAYAYIDFPTKYAAYKARIDSGMTPEQASRHVQDLYQNRDRIPKIIGEIGQGGLADYFGYTYDSVRISANQIKHARESAKNGNLLPALGFLVGHGLQAALVSATATKSIGTVWANIHRFIRREKNVDESTQMEPQTVSALRDFQAEYYENAAQVAWEERKGRERTLYYTILSGQTAWPMEDWAIGVAQRAVGSGAKSVPKAALKQIGEKLGPGMYVDTLAKAIMGEPFGSKYNTRGVWDSFQIPNDSERGRIVMESAAKYLADVYGGQPGQWASQAYDYMRGEEYRQRAAEAGAYTSSSTPADIAFGKAALIRTYRVTKGDMERLIKARVKDWSLSVKSAKIVENEPARQRGLEALVGIVRNAKTVSKDWFDDAEYAGILRDAGLNKDEAEAVVRNSVSSLGPYVRKENKTQLERAREPQGMTRIPRIGPFSSRLPAMPRP